LLAKAIIASSVSMKIRAVLTENVSNVEFDDSALGFARRSCCRAARKGSLATRSFPRTRGGSECLGKQVDLGRR
jgi:hypothetical protein